MTHNDQDFERLIQLRNEIREELKKVGPNVTNLQEAVKSIALHTELFKKLSTTAREHIKEAIQEAAQDIANMATEAFISKIEAQIQDILSPLSHSIQYARNILDVSQKAKYKKLILSAVLNSFLCGGLGTGIGYVYAKRYTYVLPPDFITTYALGQEYKEALSQKTRQEKHHGKESDLTQTIKF